MKRYLLSIPLLLLLASCDPFGTRQYSYPEYPETAEGYAPVYDTAGTARVIRADAPRDVVKGGKIYVKGTTLYQVETGKGIHVISVTDAANPVKLKFIEVLGCQELSIKDNYLYTNNVNDLVVVDITDINSPQVKDRVSNAFQLVSQGTPPSRGWYECPDPARGDVIGWEKKTLHYPKCY